MKVAEKKYISSRNSYYEKRMIYKKVRLIAYNKKSIIDKIISIIDSLLETIDGLEDCSKKEQLIQPMTGLLDSCSSLIDWAIEALLTFDRIEDYDKLLCSFSSFVAPIVCTTYQIYDNVV